MQKVLYKTSCDHTEYEIAKIKGSRFIGNIFHIQDKEDAERYLKEIQTKYPDATHHCFAYKYDVQMNWDIFGMPIYTSKHNKLSDDGEPTNTAGKPIMNMIDKYELHNVLIVVTRFFGGTLLGVGGLIQAYAAAAKQVIDHATIQQAEITKIITFAYPFDLLPGVRNILQKYTTKILEEKYEENVSMKIEINSWYVEEFKKEIWENSKGQIKII